MLWFEPLLEGLRLEEIKVRLAAVSSPDRLAVFTNEVHRRMDRMSRIHAYESVYEDVISGRLT